MDDMPTPAPGLLARARARLRGDRFMVDSRPPSPILAEPATVVAPVTTGLRPSKER